MIVPYIRSSSYGNWDFCQMQYFITYVLGHSGGAGKKAELGTIVHKVMEVLSALKKNHQDKPKNKYIVAEDEVVGKVRILRDNLFTSDFVTALEDLSYEKYTAKSEFQWRPGDRKEVARLVNIIVENGVFDPRYRHVVDPEPHFDLEIEEPWAKLDFVDANGNPITGQLSIKGTIDLVTKVDDKVIEVIDWKTGARKNWATGEVKTYEKLQNDPQLLLYHYAISRLYPEYDQTIMTIYFVKDGGPFTMCFDDSDRERFLGMLKKRFETIKNCQNPQTIHYGNWPEPDDRSKFKCNRLCHFYKNNWPGTDIPMCKYVGDHLEEFGMDDTVQGCTKPGFSVGYYEAPG